MLARLAQQARVGEQDVIGLLRAYGRDVAGALQIWDPDVPGEPKRPTLERLLNAGVAALLEHVQDNRLGNKAAGGKTSLAGVQDKIVLGRTEDGWNRVIDGWPSTHILKPESRDHPTSIYDEEFGSSAATQGRIHQEDFNQVLGEAGNQKYQKYGGKVSLKRIARVFSAVGDRASVERLFTLVTVSVSVGNLDLHAKNDGEVALAVDGEYRHAALTLNHLVAEGRSWGLARASDIAEETSPQFSSSRAQRHPTNEPTQDSPETSPGSPLTCSRDTRSGPAAIAVDETGSAPVGDLTFRSGGASSGHEHQAAV
jgi:serine/threonine-protein kinase HipA